MSIPSDYDRRFESRGSPVDPRLTRDLIALGIILVGVCGLVGVAFSVEARLGIAAICLTAIATGVFLGLDR